MNPKPVRVILLLTLVLLLPLISGCESNSNEVNIYSARKEALIKPLLDKFEAETGIKVNLVTGSPDALLQRLKSEQDNSPADLLITTDAGRLHRAMEMGLTQSIQSDSLNQVIPNSYRHPDGHWYGLSLRARPIMYAIDRVKPSELSTYAALAEPAWQGRVCIRSSSNIYNQSLLASMIHAEGVAKVEAWAAGLVANFARPPVGGDRDQIKAVASGQCDVAVANTYYLYGMHQSEDALEKSAAEQVAVFWPNQNDRGTHVNVSGAAIIKTAPNKDHAIQLLEFLSTAESQSWYAEANGEYPVRAGVEVNDLLSSWGEFKKDQVNLSQLGANNAEAVKLMDRVGWP